MTVAVPTPAFDVTEDRYEEVAPAWPLRPFVETFWVHSIPAWSRSSGRLLPDGRMELVWTRGRGVFVVGPQSRWFARPVPAPLVAYGVRFFPGAAPSLLRVPAGELVDGRIPLEDVDPLLAARIDHRLERVQFYDEAFAVLNEELVRRLALSPEPDPVVREAVELLGDSSITVAGVADRLFVSERQLQRRFAERVGYGPKTLQRILRFQQAVTELSAGARLAQAAASAGYADQSHLFRESRRLAGIPPRELAGWRH
jgi:AraC-like DNA-binding protein